MIFRRCLPTGLSIRTNDPCAACLGHKKRLRGKIIRGSGQDNTAIESRQSHHACDDDYVYRAVLQ
jgi:hypothetical protein